MKRKLILLNLGFCSSVHQSLLLTQYCAGDNIKKDGMGGACSANGAGERCVQDFGGETGGKETTGETKT
jgi:hypothetical protein